MCRHATWVSRCLLGEPTRSSVRSGEEEGEEGEERGTEREGEER